MTMPGLSKSSDRSAFLTLALLACVLIGASCKKDLAEEASDSDANGYVCLACGAKLYSARSEFLGPQCPKCSQPKLVEVIGFRCPKDQHVTIQGRSNGRQEAAVCDVCKTPLSGLSMPREKELKAWGAQKLSSKQSKT